MNLILAAFLGLSLGILIMGGTMFDVQQNVVYMLFLYACRKIFDKLFLDDIARRMNIPTRAVIKTLVGNWLREKQAIRHYLQEHPDKSYECRQCQMIQ